MIVQPGWRYLLTTLVISAGGLLGGARPTSAQASTAPPMMAVAPVTVNTATTTSLAPRAQTATYLNLRSGPGVNFARLVVLPPTDALQLLGRNAAGNWLYVVATATDGPQLASVRGWVSAPYVQSDAVIARLPIVDGSAVAPTPALPLTSIPLTPIPAPLWTPLVVTTPPPAALTQLPATPTAPSTATPMPQPTPTATIAALAVAVNPTQVQADTPVHVLITDAPAETLVQASISPPNGAQRLALPSTITDGKGLAALDFTMPGEWLDHTPIVDHTLLLTLTIASRGIVQTVVLHYQVQ